MSGWRGRFQIGALAGAALSACTVTGSIGGVTGGSGTTSTTGAGTTSTTSLRAFDKIDLLLAVDDAPGMADKQALLGQALPELLSKLTNPTCVDTAGEPSSVQPTGSLDPCPEGYTRRFSSLLDIHLGVVTSSLGSHGGDACAGVDVSSCSGGVVNTTLDDHGRLITRSDPCSGAAVPSYQNQGFLAWDPAQRDTPPGLANLTQLVVNAQALVTGAGEIGCRYPSQLESWYRFLVDPEPYATLGVSGGQAVRSGTDAAVIIERQDFLRPDSLLVILMASDQDDCSLQEHGQAYLAEQLHDPADPTADYHMPRPRSECAVDPADPCCRPCTADQTGCPADPACADPTLDADSDGYGLRCWDQKRRFGADYLYDTQRYVDGLTLAQVPNDNGGTTVNPVYTNLAPGSTATVRDASMVLLVGIVGVPWQDLARVPTDLGQGFKDADELAAAGSGFPAWEVILGDGGVPPLDAHMVASPSARSGVDPVTGTPLAPPGSAEDADPINGHEYTQAHPDALQYACVFPLAKVRSCASPGVTPCPCADPANDNPLCDAEPGNGNQRTLQVRAPAYPSLRQLRVLHDLGEQAVVTSICPAQVKDSTQADYGYRPVVSAVVDWVARRAGGS